MRFSGLYATHLANGQTQSFYVYDYANDAARFGNFSGREQRTAFGSRMAGQLDGFDYDLEGMVQTGRFSGQQVRAWGVGSIAGYTFGYVPLAPRIGVQADFASGDRNPNDGRLTTFNPLFFKGAYFLEAPISSFANVRHLKASLSLRPTAADTVNFAIGDFEKMSAADAIYATPLIALVPTRAMHGRHVGRYFQAIASHQFGPHVSLSLEYDHFVRSTALAAVRWTRHRLRQVDRQLSVLSKRWSGSPFQGSWRIEDELRPLPPVAGTSAAGRSERSRPGASAARPLSCRRK